MNPFGFGQKCMGEVNVQLIGHNEEVDIICLPFWRQAVEQFQQAHSRTPHYPSPNGSYHVR